MTSHQRLCAWLHIVAGIAIMVVLSVCLAYAAAHFRSSGLAPDVQSLVGSVGLAVGTALCVLAGLELMGGVALLSGKAIARTLLLLCSAFQMINVPLGTALGVYSFWVFYSAPAAGRPSFG